jgi:hypothetical protein
MQKRILNHSKTMHPKMEKWRFKSSILQNRGDQSFKTEIARVQTETF